MLKTMNISNVKEYSFADLLSLSDSYLPFAVSSSLMFKMVERYCLPPTHLPAYRNGTKAQRDTDQFCHAQLHTVAHN